MKKIYNRRLLSAMAFFLTYIIPKITSPINDSIKEDEEIFGTPVNELTEEDKEQNTFYLYVSNPNQKGKS